MKPLAALVLLLAAPLAAQAPLGLDFDSRVEVLEWRNGEVLPLRTTPGANLVLIFAPGEAVQAVVVGDPAAIEVQVAPQADSLTLRTLRSPVNETVEVHTQLRSYRFRLLTGPANDVAYAVRFSISAPGGTVVPNMALPPPDAANLYAIKGEVSLRPIRVSDDGTRTYIEWAKDQALPAVFALNPVGEEETVDSYMRGGVMVIDRVHPRLVFRIGKYKAVAERRTGQQQVQR